MDTNRAYVNLALTCDKRGVGLVYLKSEKPCFRIIYVRDLTLNILTNHEQLHAYSRRARL